MPTQDKGGAAASSGIENKDTAESRTSVTKEPSERERVMARMAERIAEDRSTRAVPVNDTLGDEEPDTDGAKDDQTGETASRDGGARDETDGKDAVGTGDTDTDPLAEYVVVKDGKAHVRLKVDGSERLVPLENARATLQKHEAAELRLQEAAARRKELDAREAALDARERATGGQKTTQGQPSSSDADDQDLDREAAELAKSLLTESEEEVAAKLKKVLGKNRQAPPSVDVETLASTAAERAAKALEAKASERSVREGYKRFQQDYSDIAGNPRLFAVADSMSDEIAMEHPEWSPSEIMLEAGKRTREWTESLKAPTSASDTGDRQKRKEQLRPMPKASTMRRETQQTPVRQTREEALAEIRKSRGQAA